MQRACEIDGIEVASVKRLFQVQRACEIDGYVQRPAAGKNGWKPGEPRVLSIRPYLYATSLRGKGTHRMLQGKNLLICEVCFAKAMRFPDSEEHRKLRRAIDERLISLYNSCCEGITA